MSLMMSQPRIDVTSEVRVRAMFDPPAVRPGEIAIYRLTFNALGESIEMPVEIPAPKELELRPGARGQMLQMAGGALVPVASFNYRARAAAAGEFTIPEFTVQVYGKPVTVPAARLEVMASPPGGPRSPHLSLEVAATNLYVGQPVLVRVYLPGSSAGMGQPLTQVQITGNGFLVDQGASGQRVVQMARDGVNLSTFVYETTLTPIEAGTLTCFAQGFTAGMQFAGPISISGQVMMGGPPANTLHESDPIEIQARPLPREGELPGFTGAIGSFAVDPPKLATNDLSVGEPVRMTVTVHVAQGNLGRMVPPPPPQVREWQALPAVGDGTPPQLIQARGFAVFDYTLVPLSEDVRSTPPIPFSFFDPQTGRYNDLTVPSVPVTVQPGATPSDLQALTQTAPATDEEPQLKMSDLAAAPGRAASSLTPVQQASWFALAQLLPASAFLGLWAWDRRRRYFEQHPQELIRRRARRALRREWRAWKQAARRGDPVGFRTTAVSALRVGCAPHYPAEPRALVGSDVLRLLNEEERAGQTGNAVRRVFAATDAARFTAEHDPEPDLFSLEPELDQVMQHLEAKL